MKAILRTLLCFSVLLVSFGRASAEETKPAPKPNIIFILSDDVGLGNIGCYGGAFKTPNIDAMAAGGTRFEFCYACPLCGPSRATCLTGRYLFRTGMLLNSSAKQMHTNEIMLPKVLKPAGYVTAQVGKWNQLPLEPSQWGFDEYLRFQGSGKYWSSQDKTYTVNGAPKQLGTRYLPDVEHEFLVDFMTRHKDQPFYVHYAMSSIHTPILPTPDSKPNGDLYADNNAYMDKLVGQLVSALEKLGLREKTLLIFVGDNGTARPGAKEATVDDRDISGLKGKMLEGGSRVPLIVNWPGTTPAGKVLKDLTDFSDFMPTFAELAGAKLPEGVTIDGHSFAPQTRGEKGNPRDSVFVQLGEQWYARDAKWKLTNDGAMFDMTKAPFEEKPVSYEKPDAEVEAAKTKLEAVLKQLNPGGEKGELTNREKKKAERRAKRKGDAAAAPAVTPTAPK